LFEVRGNRVKVVCWHIKEPGILHYLDRLEEVTETFSGRLATVAQMRALDLSVY